MEYITIKEILNNNKIDSIITNSELITIFQDHKDYIFKYEHISILNGIDSFHIGSVNNIKLYVNRDLSSNKDIVKIYDVMDNNIGTFKMYE